MSLSVEQQDCGASTRDYGAQLAIELHGRHRRAEVMRRLRQCLAAHHLSTIRAFGRAFSSESRLDRHQVRIGEHVPQSVDDTDTVVRPSTVTRDSSRMVPDYPCLDAAFFKQKLGLRRKHPHRLRT